MSQVPLTILRRFMAVFWGVVTFPLLGIVVFLLIQFWTGINLLQTLTFQRVLLFGALPGGVCGLLVPRWTLAFVEYVWTAILGPFVP